MNTKRHLSSIYTCILFTGMLMISRFAGGQEVGKEQIIKFKQNDTTLIINGAYGKIHLDTNPFIIRFSCPYYDATNHRYHAMQVAALDNEQDLQHLTEGQPVSAIPYYAPGTGMAPDENGFYSGLTITNTGHHYLYYENDTSRRVNLVSNTTDIPEMEWIINDIFQNPEENLPQSNPATTLFIVFFSDLNLNGILDPREITIVEVATKAYTKH